MTGLQILYLSGLVVLVAGLVWWACELLLSQERRHAEWRADIDQAIALTVDRHPAGTQIPAGDRPDWPPT